MKIRQVIIEDLSKDKLFLCPNKQDKCIYTFVNYGEHPNPRYEK